MKKLAKPQYILKSQTTRLAITYLLIIMLMSISFSVILFIITVSQLDRQLPPGSYYKNIPISAGGLTVDIPYESFDSFFHQRIDEGKAELVLRLIWSNLGTLLIGGVISYYLARRSLKPIEDVMEAQVRFVSDASHEIRTPLTVLQTTNEVALRNKKLTLKEAKSILEHNIEEATKLKNLSDNLLNLLKDDSSRIDLTSVAMQDVVSESMSDVVNQAIQKNIEVSDETRPIDVLANYEMLSQVLTILLDNAVKYSRPGGIITIKSKSKSNQVYIEVIDRGIGIKAADLPYIFDRFYRADNSRTKIKESGGYGLGLAIAKRLTETMGGSIGVRSVPSKGSTFTVKLPNAKSKLNLNLIAKLQ